jgi:hypothetical protein
MASAIARSASSVVEPFGRESVMSIFRTTVAFDSATQSPPEFFAKPALHAKLQSDELLLRV